MKQLVPLVVSLLLWLMCATACSKDEDASTNPPDVPANNRAPVARAGSDKSFLLSVCSKSVEVVELDGTVSSDPDRNIVRYNWVKLSGPEESVLRNATSVRATLESVVPGEYALELTVTDAGNLSSKDTTAINVTTLEKGFDLDIASVAAFTVTERYVVCPGWDYDDCQVYDATMINAVGTFPVLGDVNVHLYEFADTTSEVVHENNIAIYAGQGSLFVSGTFSVNFKKLIRQGGGAFSGTIQITDGSARACDPYVFANQSLLAITGDMNLATRKVSLKITGKTTF